MLGVYSQLVWRSMCGNSVSSLIILSSHGDALVTIVLGKTGAGKSSLVESVTDSTGLSGDTLESGEYHVERILKVPCTNGLIIVTTKCEIREASVGGRSYFVIDTPGFDDERGAWDTSIHITEIVNAIRTLGATIAGIWYVIDNSRPRDEEIHAKLRNWLVEFCGSDFFPYLTFITTFWDYTDAQHGVVLNSRLAERQELWREFLDGGAKTYQHGKVYDELGEKTTERLSWYGHKDALVSQAKAMLSRVCLDSPTVQPKVVRELWGGSSCEDVSAADVFRPRPRIPPSTPENPGQPTPEGQSAPQGPSPEQPSNQDPSPHSGNSAPESNEQMTTGWDRFIELVGVVLDHTSITVNAGGGGFQFGSSSTQARRPFPSSQTPIPGHLDPEGSIVDRFHAHKQDPSLQHRAVVADRLGIPGEPGTEAHNIRFNKVLGSRIDENGGRWPL